MFLYTHLEGTSTPGFKHAPHNCASVGARLRNQC